IRARVRRGLRGGGVPARGRWPWRVPPRPATPPRSAAPHGRRMKLERVELFVVRLPLKNAYETSGARETHMTRVVCRVESEGAVGWGESVAGETPWYSGETAQTVLYALETFILPELFKVDLASAEDVDRKLAWIREHRMAKETIEMALWDLFAKRANKPLSALLGGTRDRILCGVAIGIQPSIDALMETIRRE